MTDCYSQAYDSTPFTERHPDLLTKYKFDCKCRSWKWGWELFQCWWWWWRWSLNDDDHWMIYQKCTMQGLCWSVGDVSPAAEVFQRRASGQDGDIQDLLILKIILIIMIMKISTKIYHDSDNPNNYHHFLIRWASTQRTQASCRERWWQFRSWDLL